MKTKWKLAFVALAVVGLGLSFSPFFSDPETSEPCSFWTWIYKEAKVALMLKEAIA